VKDSNDYLGRMATRLQNRLIEIAGDNRGEFRDFEPGTAKIRCDLALTMNEEHDGYLLDAFVDRFREEVSDRAFSGPVRWWRLPTVEIGKLPEMDDEFSLFESENIEDHDFQMWFPWSPRTLVVRFTVEA
jgi:hypothetical protein